MGESAEKYWFVQKWGKSGNKLDLLTSWESPACWDVVTGMKGSVQTSSTPALTALRMFTPGRVTGFSLKTPVEGGCRPGEPEHLTCPQLTLLLGLCLALCPPVLMWCFRKWFQWFFSHFSQDWYITVRSRCEGELIQYTQWVPEVIGFNPLAGPRKEARWLFLSQPHCTKDEGLPCPWPHPLPRPHWNVRSGQNSCLNKPWYIC